VRAEHRPVRDDLNREHADELREADLRVRQAGVPVGGAANLNMLYELTIQTTSCELDHRATGNVVETGVAAGWSSLAILLALERTGGRLWSTDLPYPYLSQDFEWIGVAVPDRLKPIWRLTRGADRDVLPEVLAEAAPCDLAHYDSDKSYRGARWAYELLWDSLRPGGVLIADDIGDHLAFRDFSRQIDVPGAVIADGKKFQGLLLRP
jgi:predicted O-methyltransferase YrrM